jgi:hypothetical protein
MDYINACFMKGLIKFHSLLFSVFPQIFFIYVNNQD